MCFCPSNPGWNSDFLVLAFLSTIQYCQYSKKCGHSRKSLHPRVKILGSVCTKVQSLNSYFDLDYSPWVTDIDQKVNCPIRHPPIVHKIHTLIRIFLTSYQSRFREMQNQNGKRQSTDDFEKRNTPKMQKLSRYRKKSFEFSKFCGSLSPMGYWTATVEK